MRKADTSELGRTLGIRRAEFRPQHSAACAPRVSQGTTQEHFLSHDIKKLHSVAEEDDSVALTTQGCMTWAVTVGQRPGNIPSGLRVFVLYSSSS